MDDSRRAGLGAMHVAELWRYPVKSMAGERISSIEVSESGLAGDRRYWIAGGPRGVHTARTKPGLLRMRAATASDGSVLVDGFALDASGVAQRIRRAAGADARLEPTAGLFPFDVLPLLVTSDGALRELGIDPRRLRPNLILGGVPGLSERSWEGRFLAAGEVVIGFEDLRGRCVMTTFDPDTGAQDVGVLEDIHARFGGTFGLNARVARGGRLREGDGARLLEPAEAEALLGGPQGPELRGR